MGTSIIIVNYNVTNEVRNCLSTIKSVLTGTVYEILVVDNNSADRSIVSLTKEFPEVRFLLLEENLGYSKANNIAALQSVFENLLFLNPDTILIDNFVSVFENDNLKDPGLGACAPILVYDNLSYQNSWGYKLGFIYEIAEAFMFINTYRKILVFLKRGNYRNGKSFVVGWMSGACLYVRKEIFMKAGMFNEGFFLNYEDIDLGGRISSLGFRNTYYPNLRCIHLDQTSQKRDLRKFTLSRYQSRLIYADFNYGVILRFIVRLIHISGLLMRLLIVNFTYNGNERNERRLGYFDAFKLYIGLRK